MKVKAFCFTVLVSFFFFYSCDSMLFTGYVGPQGTKGETGDPGPKGPTGDAGAPVAVKPDDPEPPDLTDYSAFVSLTGERNAMFYLEPDPDNPNKMITLESPVGTYTDGIGYGAYVGLGEYQQNVIVYGNSKISLACQLCNLINPTNFYARASGYCAILGYVLVNMAGYKAYDANYHATFDNITTPFTVSSSAIDYTKNKYPVLELFNNNDLALPKTRDYSSALKVYRDLTFSIKVTKEQLESMVPATHPSAYDVKAYGCDLTASVTTNERHKLSNAGYYQYLNLTVAYPPETSIFDIVPSSIVASFNHDVDTNSITVVFKDYSTPYTGEVLTYTLVTTDGKQYKKVLEIQ